MIEHSDAGLDGSNAGTSLRASLLALNKPTKGQQKIMDKLGFSLLDSAGNAKGLSTIIGDLENSLRGESDAQKVATLQSLVGTEAVSGFLALVKAGPAVIDKQTQALRDSAGASKEAADKMKAGIGGALEELSGAFESAAILIGDQLVPYIIELAKFVGNLVNKFNEASPAFQKISVIGAALAAVFALIAGPLLLLVGFLPNIIAGFGAVGTVFGALVSPIALVIAAIGLIVGALIVAYNEVESFRNSVNEIWTRISDDAVAAFEALKKFAIDVFQGLVDAGKAILDTFAAFWKKHGEEITKNILDAYESIKKGISDAIKAVLDFIKPQLDKIKTFWEENGMQILEAVKNAFDLIYGVIDFIMPAIEFIIKYVWENIKKVISGALDVILGLIKVFSGLFTGDFTKVWEGIKQIFFGAIDVILGYMSLTFLGGIRTALVNLAKTSVAALKGLAKSFVDILKGINLSTLGKNIVEGMIKGIKSKIGDVVNAAKDIANGVGNTIKSILGIASPSKVTTQFGKWTGEGLANGITSTKGTVSKASEDLAKVVAEATRKSEAEAVKVATVSARKKKETQAAYNARVYAANVKANQASVAQAQKLAKDKLDAIKTYVSDKQSLDQLTLLQEAEVWRKTVGFFKEGTKERIEAQRAYQTTLQTINDKIVAVNDEYGAKMVAINDRLKDSEKSLTDAYTSAVSAREKSLVSFVGTFAEFDLTAQKSGTDLLKNLTDQVNGFKFWQEEIDKLTDKAIDKGLLAELRELGPNALPELVALNSLTADQLTQYSTLYAEKSRLARTQAVAELSGLKADTTEKIKALRVAANTELEALRTEWAAKIKAVTTTTATELKSLQDIGKNAGLGLLKGLASTEPALQAKAKSIADTISKTISSALQIKSPSRVLTRLGEFVGAGLEVGMLNSVGGIRGAARSLAVAATPSIAPAGVGVASMGAYGASAAVSADSGSLSGMFDGANFYVRSDDDIPKLARELQRYADQAKQRRGRR